MNIWKFLITIIINVRFFLIALVIYAISRPDFVPLERILFFLTNSPSWIIKSSPFKVKTYAFFTSSNLLTFSIDGSNVLKYFQNHLYP